VLFLSDQRVHKITMWRAIQMPQSLSNFLGNLSEKIPYFQVRGRQGP
jgi:hypothetical protein